MEEFNYLVYKNNITDILIAVTVLLENFWLTQTDKYMIK